MGRCEGEGEDGTGPPRARERFPTRFHLLFLARHPATIDPYRQHDSKEVRHAYLYNSVTVDRSGYS